MSRLRFFSELGAAGFTLIESVVALVLLSATLMILAPVLFHVANHRIQDEGVTEREAVLRSETNRLTSLSFNQLDAQTGCRSDSSDDFPHTSCVTVFAVSFNERTVRIEVTPASARIARDSVVFTRTSSRANPFYSPQP